MLLCELDGRVGGCWFASWPASLTAGCLGACSFGCWWMLFCELDGWVLGACSLGCWWMLSCELDGRVLGGMPFEVLVDAALRD